MGTVGIYIQYILHSLVLTFDPKSVGVVCVGGGGGGVKIKNKNLEFCFMFSSRFMLFRTFLEKEHFGGGGEGGVKKCLWC